MAQRQGILKTLSPRIPPMAALRYANFRWFWISTSAQSIAQGMQFLMLGWLVLELTDSVSRLGLTIFFYGIPNLSLVLFGGIFADRFNRRTLLVLAQLGVAATMAGVATLTVTGLVNEW